MGTGDRLPVISETHVVEIAQGPDILQMIDSTAVFNGHSDAIK
jgi:hypothetical protein